MEIGVLCLSIIIYSLAIILLSLYIYKQIKRNKHCEEVYGYVFIMAILFWASPVLQMLLPETHLWVMYIIVILKCIVLFRIIGVLK
jgi:hypothetical protein